MAGRRGIVANQERPAVQHDDEKVDVSVLVEIGDDALEERIARLGLEQPERDGCCRAEPVVEVELALLGVAGAGRLGIDLGIRARLPHRTAEDAHLLRRPASLLSRAGGSDAEGSYRDHREVG